MVKRWIQLHWVRHYRSSGNFLRSLASEQPEKMYRKVQEKKNKKISDMNVDPSKPAGNCTVASSSGSSNPKLHLANGGSPDRFYNYSSNGLSFSPGGIPSLRLPVRW